LIIHFPIAALHLYLHGLDFNVHLISLQHVIFHVLRLSSSEKIYKKFLSSTALLPLFLFFNQHFLHLAINKTRW